MLAFVLPFLLLAALALMPLTLAPAGFGETNSPARSSIAARPLAQAMLEQQQALISWAEANPGTTGPVSQAELNLASPWSGAYQLSSLIGGTPAGPIAVTWYGGGRASPGALADALIAIEGAAQDVGVTCPAGLSSPAGRLTPLPAGTPNGLAAIADPTD